MIKINLLKHAGAKRTKTNCISYGKRWGILGGAILLVVAVLFFGLRFLPEKRPVTTSVLVGKRDTTSYKPSTYSKANIVEDVVREISDERSVNLKRGLLAMDYNDLSFIEKVNYEVLFGKNVFALLGRCVPPGIGLNTLEINNFQTMYAVGSSTSRNLIAATFEALKAEPLDLLPQPFSYITPDKKNGFRFVVTGKTHFGLDLADPFQASDHLPARADLSILLKRITQQSAQDTVHLLENLKEMGAEKVGVYRRLQYRYRATATYAQFVQLLADLYAQKIPCAFKKVTIKAKNGVSVEIDAELILTLRD